MEGDKGGSGSSCRVSDSFPLDHPVASPPQPQQPAIPAPAPKPAKETPAMGQRQLFTVELRPGETTIVSWKKLIAESGSGNGEASTCKLNANNPAPEVRPNAGVRTREDDLQHTLQPPNCFSAVIEKIERLYMGKESSDEEELDGVPDDDQYDTEDSFIDDTELDEYFQVDKLSTKHNGYFVNRGKLEWTEASSSPNMALKKRRRKEPGKVQNESNHEHVSTEHANISNMKIKAAARNAPLVARKLSPAKVATSSGEHYQDGKLLKTKANASTGIYKKRTGDFANSSEVPSARKTNRDTSSGKLELKDFDKNRSLPLKDHYKSSGAVESFDATYQAYREKGVASQIDPQPKKVCNGENEFKTAKVPHKERLDTGEYSQLTSYPTYPVTNKVREGTMRPKGTALERAIRDLEKIVALSRPPYQGHQEGDPSAQGVKRRLPQEVKLKLAKVARLSANQSKISEEEIIDRLMGFLSHLVQRKKLKRSMKEMVELGISAKQQKTDKFLQIKKEVLEMIKERVALLKSKAPNQQDASTDDFRDVVNTDDRRLLTGRYSLDVALEDRICDLYDLYVEGMDEDKGPQSRKLYVELAELWPVGYMDNLGIKDAIYRAKKRRRHKAPDQDRIERRKPAVAAKSEEPSLPTQTQASHERPVVDSTLAFAPRDKPISFLNTQLPSGMMDQIAYPNDSVQHFGYGSKLVEKGGGNSTGANLDGGSKASPAEVKRRLKRKSETDVEPHTHPMKMQAQAGKEKNSNIILQQPKPSSNNPMPSAASISDQQS